MTSILATTVFLFDDKVSLLDPNSHNWAGLVWFSENVSTVNYSFGYKIYQDGGQFTQRGNLNGLW